MTEVQQCLRGFDITAAVEKMQSYVASRAEEGSKERRALEYRIKEALAAVESALSAKLTDVSLDPIRETHRVLLGSIQDLDKRINQAYVDIKSIDIAAVSQDFHQKMDEFAGFLHALSVDMTDLKAESVARKASELVSTRALKPQVCLACGSKSSSKAPGLLGVDSKLYRGDSMHNRGSSSGRKQTGTHSELFSETEKEGGRHKPSLSLAMEPLQVSESAWKRANLSVAPRHSTPLATGPLWLFTPQSSTHRGANEPSGGSLRRGK